MILYYATKIKINDNKKNPFYHYIQVIKKKTFYKQTVNFPWQTKFFTETTP